MVKHESSGASNRTLRGRLRLAVIAMMMSFLATPIGAIIDGEFDGDDHPYVAVIFLLSPERFIIDLCSGAAIGPTLVVTAAHCFPEPGQQVFVSFDADLTGDTDGEPVPHIVTGTWYPDPRFCRGCGPAASSMDGQLAYDGAVVVLHESVVLERYAALPSVGELDTLGSQPPRLDVVGYGVQTRLKEFDPFTEPVTRNVAQVELSPGDAPVGADFVRLSANVGQGKGHVCAGDSGGPVLDGDTILATLSMALNGNCSGVAYAYRLDTNDALAFILEFVGA